jgi:hypothetical protein
MVRIEIDERRFAVLEKLGYVSPRTIDLGRGVEALLDSIEC